MISSLCTIANKKSTRELRILMDSFRLFHSDIPIYVGCDSAAEQKAKKWGAKTERIIPDTMLPDQNCPEWLELMLKKTDIMDVALSNHPDTLFVDADMLFLAALCGINTEDREVALSPHYINKADESKYGRYNGGYVWTSETTFPKWWRDNTHRSKYYEQQTLVYAADVYAIQELRPNHNYSWWRLDQVEKRERKKRRTLFRVEGKRIMYGKWPLVSVHTHITSKDKKFCSINSITKTLLEKSGATRHKQILEWITT